MKAPKPPRRHHFVPESYLKRFCGDNGCLQVFDRSTQSFWQDRPKKVMWRRDYHRQAWAPAGIDPYILEITLGNTLEADAKNAIDTLIAAPHTLSDEEVGTLLIYFEFQRIRVPRQLERGMELSRDLILQIAPTDIVADIRLGRYFLTLNDAMRLQILEMLIGQFHPWFGKMEWEIFQASAGSSFITTDSPVSFYNSRFLPPDEAGIGLAGTVVLIPLSSSYALIMRHSKFRLNPKMSQIEALPIPVTEDGHIMISHGAVWPKEKVDRFNWNMLMLSQRFVVASNKETLDTCNSFHSNGS